MPLIELQPTEYNAYYQQYLDKITGKEELHPSLRKGKSRTLKFFQTLTAAQWMRAYAPGKWTPKEVLQHLIDTERIFGYRAFRIARRDTTSLAGFDQDIYIQPSGANDKTAEQLLEEYTATRDYTLSLVKSLSADDLAAMGTANGTPLSARAALWILIAHDIWHIDIIKERYL
ncbi:MAG: DinB family protein [Bacteroidota bacterium]